MPEGPFGVNRLTSIGPFVEETWEDIVDNTTPDADVYFSSSESMEELDNRSVHLSVTSPPYNIGWDYGSYEDDLEFLEYKELMGNVMSETHRVLERQGRLCLVIPTLVRGGSEGGMSHLQIMLNIAQEAEEEWQEREVIIWNKGTGVPPRYSTFPDPWGVLITSTHECILVLQKPGRRPDSSKPSQEIREVSEWEEWAPDVTKDVWNIPTVQETGGLERERVPAFPKEVPRRLIKHYSFITDTVLDPFAGTGTTLSAALDEGRNAVGYEIREELLPIIRDSIGMETEIQMGFNQ